MTTVQIWENPSVPKGHAVMWLGDVCVHRGRLGELPEDLTFDAIDLHPDDFAKYAAEEVGELLDGEMAGSA